MTMLLDDKDEWLAPSTIIVAGSRVIGLVLLLAILATIITIIIVVLVLAILA